MRLVITREIKACVMYISLELRGRKADRRYRFNAWGGQRVDLGDLGKRGGSAESDGRGRLTPG